MVVSSEKSGREELAAADWKASTLADGFFQARPSEIQFILGEDHSFQGVPSS